MARKKKTKTEAELSLTNPFERAVAAKVKGAEVEPEAAEPAEANETGEAPESSPADTTITVSGEAEAEPTVTDSPADVSEEPEPAASQAALRPSPVVTTEERDARSLGTDEHGGIREDRLLTRETNGDLVYGLDPAGPTARVYQRGDVHLGQAMYGQTVVCRVRGASEEQACADLARGITEASRPEAESFRRAVRWGE